MRWWIVVVTVSALSAGCGGDGDGDRDGGEPDAAGERDGAASDGGEADAFVLAMPAAPAPAETPRLTPCASGWSAITAAGSTASRCQPWPADAVTTCPAGQARFPGDAACAPLGPACAGDFASDLPAAASLYVRAGATGGDGSQLRPYATIAEAMTRATAGTIIAVGRGTYAEAVVMRDQVTLWGACVAGTRIVPPAASTTAAVRATGVGASIRNLTVAASRSGINVSQATGMLVLGNVVVETAADFAIRAVTGAALMMNGVIIRDVVLGPGQASMGVLVEMGGRATATRVRVEHVLDSALLVADPQSTASFDDSLFTGVTGTGPRDSGVAVEVILQGSVTLRRVLIEDVAGVGVGVGTQSSGTLEDVMIRDVALSAVTMAGGLGATATDGSNLVLRRMAIERVALQALIIDELASALISHLAIQDAAYGGVTVRRSSLSGGWLSIAGGSGGLDVIETSTIDLADVTLSDFEPLVMDDYVGLGISISSSAANIRRAELLRCRISGISVVRGARATLEDITIADTRPGYLSGAEFGYALAVLTGATAEASRVRVSKSRLVGVGVQEPGSRLLLRDAHISGTVELGCGSTTCPGWRGTGTGIGAYYGGSVEVHDFVTTGNQMAGVQVDPVSTMDLEAGLVADNPIGANVQGAGYDLARLSQSVVFANRINIDTEALPLPPRLVVP